MMDVADNNPFLTIDKRGNKKKNSSNAIKDSKIKGSKKLDKDLVEFVNEEIEFQKPLPLKSEKPIIENQRMLRNLEAHEIIMTVIKQNSLKGVESMDLYHKVLKNGYSTLIRFVRGSRSNQK